MDHLEALREFRASLDAARTAGDIDPLEIDAVIAELGEILMELEVGA